MATGVRILNRGKGLREVVWGYAAGDDDESPTGLVGGETGDPIETGGLTEKCVQANGTIGTTTSVQLQGGNRNAAAAFKQLRDLGSTPIELVPLEGLWDVRENPRWSRVVVGAGTATGIVVRMFTRTTGMKVN